MSERANKKTPVKIGLRTVDSVDGRSTGIAKGPDGFTALTNVQSETFKTIGGAVRWLAKRGYAPTGERL